jgi:hypothetical protein
VFTICVAICWGAMCRQDVCGYDQSHLMIATEEIRCLFTLYTSTVSTIDVSFSSCLGWHVCVVQQHAYPLVRHQLHLLIAQLMMHGASWSHQPTFFNLWTEVVLRKTPCLQM